MLNWKEELIVNKSILINRNGEYDLPKGRRLTGIAYIRLRW
jgi:hypothetical protein